MTRTIDARSASGRTGTIRDEDTRTRRSGGPGREGTRDRAQAPARSVRGRRVGSTATAAGTARRVPPSEYARRVPFVVVVLGLIGTGVGGTLWLSAQSTEETYALKDARDANVHLVERKESLQASNERARSAEVLAERAQKLGMVGVDSAPILVRGVDGTVQVVGEPQAKLGAPIEPLQPAPVPSGASTPPPAAGFGTPPAQSPQDTAPRGGVPVPYPPVAGPPAAQPPSPQAPSPAPQSGPQPPQAQARQDAPAQAPVATLSPVPGELR